MTGSEGALVWLVPDLYLPALGPPGLPPSHECLSVLNVGDQQASLEITVYYTDRPAGEGLATVPARSTRHLRTDRPEDLGGLDIPREVPHAARIRSDTPVTVQHSRLDTSTGSMALMTTIAHATTSQ
jgi:hypothetical protein